MELVFSDEALAIVVPIAAYWVYSGMYMALGRSMDQYRLHPREEERNKNLVSKRDVVKGVLLQQLVQAAVAAAIFTRDGRRRSTAADDLGHVPDGGDADRGGHVHAGRVAVRVAPVHAPQQVPVPARPLVAPPPRRALRLRCTVQPPRGGPPPRHRRRRARLPRLRHVAPRLHLLLHALHRQGRGRPLRPVAAGERVPPLLLEQHVVPRRPPSAAR
uniref:Uncharacterized protein n=1 Tax=Aegilops tauschii subsp. strangulata TaxID=200361 RepID=A0A453QKM6_AEGTS